MSTKIKIILALLFMILLSWFLWRNERPVYENSRPALGTVVRIKVSGKEGERAAVAAFQELARLTALFSRFSPNSEVSRLNRAAGLGPQAVSSEMLELLQLAEEIRRLSNGAFDVLLGSGRLKIGADGRVSLSAGASLDLGGIAKGYAIEKTRELLLKLGVKNAIIDSRSAVAVIGGPWQVGLADPRSDQIIDVIELRDGEALSTSSQAEQPGHLIDPRRHRPAGELQSVTVIAKDAGLADALSTAIFVLGEKDGCQLAEKMKIKVLIIRRNGEIYDNFSAKLR